VEIHGTSNYPWVLLNLFFWIYYHFMLQVYGVLLALAVAEPTYGHGASGGYDDNQSQYRPQVFRHVNSCKFEIECVQLPESDA